MEDHKITKKGQNGIYHHFNRNIFRYSRIRIDGRNI